VPAVPLLRLEFHRSQADGLLRQFDGVKASLICPSTTTISDLHNRPAATFEQWAKDHVAELR
jgi:hypothetical protein